MLLFPSIYLLQQSFLNRIQPILIALISSIPKLTYLINTSHRSPYFHEYLCNILTPSGHEQLLGVTLRIIDWSHKSPQVLLTCFILAYMLPEKEVTYYKISLQQACLTMKFLRVGFLKRRCTFGNIGSHFKSFLSNIRSVTIDFPLFFSICCEKLPQLYNVNVISNKYQLYPQGACF